MQRIRYRIISRMLLFIVTIILSMVYIFTALFHIGDSSNIPMKSNSIVFMGEDVTDENIETGDHFEVVSSELRYGFYSILIMQGILLIAIAIMIGISFSNIILVPLNRARKYISKIDFIENRNPLNFECGEDNCLLAKEVGYLSKKVSSAYDDIETFNSFASHELRNSLAILSTKAQINGSGNEVSSYVGVLGNTVEDMLLLSSSRSRADIELSKVDLAIVAARAVDEYSIKHQNIELIIPDDGVEEIYGREVWIYRCISNLIENSIKYGYKDAPIIVEVEGTINSVVLKVSDRSEGIDPRNIKYIFEPYYRIKESKKDGNGIGLALVKKVIDLMNGAIWVDSNKGVGTQFYLSFPLIEEVDA